MPDLRRAAGFRVEFAYGIPGLNEVIWAVSVDGSAEHFAEVKETCLASNEWAAVMSAIPERVAEQTVQTVTIIDGAGQ